MKVEVKTTSVVDVSNCEECPVSTYVESQDDDFSVFSTKGFHHCTITNRLMRGAGGCIPEDCPLRAGPQVQTNNSATRTISIK